jgi:hypothetical protein
MKKKEVVKVATDYARERSYDPARYTVTSVMKEPRSFLVLFDGLSGLPGDHFSVRVSRDTLQAVELMPGE